MNTPYLRHKDYDHEDIDNDMRSDTALSLMAHVLGSLGMACTLMACIAIMLQIPSAWLSWVDLYLRGV